MTMNVLEKWRLEYQQQGIPSSSSTEPSHSLCHFFTFLTEQRESYQGKRWIDLGCGRGRNSRYALQQGLSVTAVDLVPENAALLQGLPLEAFALDLTQPWPFADAQFDFAYDAFCFKHLVTEQGRQNYIEELARTLRPGGYYALNLAALEDGYYRQFFTPNAQLPNTIMDPGNGIASILYDQNQLTALFTPYFTLCHYQERSSTSPMYGVSYERKIVNSIWQRKHP